MKIIKCKIDGKPTKYNVDGKIMTKEQIIEDIEENNENYKTINDKGPNVNVVHGKTGNYIRTDGNDYEEDDLGNLAKCSWYDRS